MNHKDLVDLRERNRVAQQGIMLATPMYNGVAHAEYARSREAAIAGLKELGYKVYLNYTLNDSLLTHARNACAQQFLNQADCSHLMFIDADMGFDQFAIPRLLFADKDIICGAAPRKTINWEAVRAAALRGEQDLEAFSGSYALNTFGAASQAGGLLEVKNAGTGFMLVKRGVFEVLRDKVARCTELDGEMLHSFFDEGADEDGLYLSEDFHFCYKWRAEGGCVFVDPFIKLTHTGTYTFRGDIIKGLAS